MTTQAFIARLSFLPLAFTVGIATYLVVVNAVLSIDGRWALAQLLAGLGSLLVVFFRLRAPFRTHREPVEISTTTADVESPLKGSELLFLALVSAVVGAYALSWYWLQVPPDFWIDFPQQSFFRERGLDLTHPYFPDITLGGQYGRNLLIAGLSQLTSIDLILVKIWVTILTQWLLVSLVYCLFRRHSPRQARYTVCILFFGLGVGGWAGLLDHFFHHAALAHLLFFAVWDLFARRERQSVLVLLALGLVYPLYLVLACIPWLWTLRKNRNFAALIVATLMIAPLQGGPLRQLLSSQQEVPKWIASQQQSFVLEFPKDQIFQIQLEPWSYWRRSLGLGSLPFLSNPPDYQKPGYAFVLGWDVLQLHWLALWLLPWSAYYGGSDVRRWSGVAAIAYFTPSLVSFGPVYEAEYYRWELAAGVACGVALAGALTKPPQTNHPGVGAKWGWLSSLLLLLCCWPGIYQLSQMKWDLRLPSQLSWIEHHAKSLRLRKGELKTLTKLAELQNPGERLWRDSLPDFDDNRAIYGDALAIGLTGLQMSGKALPLPHDFIGRPPFRPSLNAKTFWRIADPQAVQREGVNWLLANRESDYSQSARLVMESEEVRLWKVFSTQLDNAFTSAAYPKELEDFAAIADETVRLPTATRGPFSYHWESADNPEWRSQPVYLGGKNGFYLSTPELPGEYKLHLSNGLTARVSVKPKATLRNLRILSSSLSNNMASMVVRNESPRELRLHNVYLALLPMNRDGKYEKNQDYIFHEVFVISGSSEIQLTVPFKATELPERASLYFDSREGNRPVPLR